VPERFTADDFRPCLGQSFLLRDGAVEIRLELESVTLLGEARPGAPAGGYAAFSLIFRPSAHLPVRQRIFRLEHPELGALDLFVVEIQSDARGPRCEVIFT